MNTFERMQQLEKSVRMCVDQQNGVAVRLNELGKVINNQAAVLQQMQEEIERNHNAFTNIYNWLSVELGDEAVERLKKTLDEYKADVIPIEDADSNTGE